jgi:hypothetical protein
MDLVFEQRADHLDPLISGSPRGRNGLLLLRLRPPRQIAHNGRMDFGARSAAPGTRPSGASILGPGVEHGHVGVN